MARRPLRIRYTLSEAREALLLPSDAPLVQYAEAAGIEVGAGDSLSEAQIRAISDYLDGAMADPNLAQFHAANGAAVRGAVRRRGGLRPEAVRR